MYAAKDGYIQYMYTTHIHSVRFCSCLEFSSPTCSVFIIMPLVGPSSSCPYYYHLFKVFPIDWSQVCPIISFLTLALWFFLFVCPVLNANPMSFSLMLIKSVIILESPSSQTSYHPNKINSVPSPITETLFTESCLILSLQNLVLHLTENVMNCIYIFYQLMHSLGIEPITLVSPTPCLTVWATGMVRG